MSSLVSTGSQEIVNWVTTADGCVHTDDTTKLSPTSCEFVYTPPTPTRQNSFVSSASAVCIGHCCLANVALLSLQFRSETPQNCKKTRAAPPEWRLLFGDMWPVMDFIIALPMHCVYCLHKPQYLNRPCLRWVLNNLLGN